MYDSVVARHKCRQMDAIYMSHNSKFILCNQYPYGNNIILKQE